jgi:hypothetical protein
MIQKMRMLRDYQTMIEMIRRNYQNNYQTMKTIQKKIDHNMNRQKSCYRNEHLDIDMKIHIIENIDRNVNRKNIIDLMMSADIKKRVAAVDEFARFAVLK